MSIKNTSKEEIPQAKIYVFREEVITIKKDRKTHRRMNVCRIRSLKWGPILPQSIFTRKLAIPVCFSGNPPSLNGGDPHSGNLSFNYFVSLEADVTSHQRKPYVKVGFALMEGKRPDDIRGLSVGGGMEEGVAQSEGGKGASSPIRGGYGKMMVG